MIKSAEICRWGPTLISESRRLTRLYVFQGSPWWIRESHHETEIGVIRLLSARWKMAASPRTPILSSGLYAFSYEPPPLRPESRASNAQVPGSPCYLEQWPCYDCSAGPSTPSSTSSSFAHFDIAEYDSNKNVDENARVCSVHPMDQAFTDGELSATSQGSTLRDVYLYKGGALTKYLAQPTLGFYYSSNHTSLPNTSIQKFISVSRYSH